MVLPTAAVGVNNRGNRPRLGLRFAKESAGESNASMPSVPGPLHAIGRVSAFSLSVRHRTPFPRARDSDRAPSAANHPAKHHQRIIGDRPASDRTDFELPRRSVQADVRRQPASTARTALRDASIVRHNRLRRQNVDRLFARRAGNAVSRMTHGSTTLVWLLVTDAPRPEKSRGVLRLPSIVRGIARKCSAALVQQMVITVDVCVPKQDACQASADSEFGAQPTCTLALAVNSGALRSTRVKKRTRRGAQFLLVLHES